MISPIGMHAIAANSQAFAEYMVAACVALGGVLGILVVLNVKDSAYRIYEYYMNKGSSFDAGRLFTPLLVRFVGGFLALALVFDCVKLISK